MKKTNPVFNPNELDWEKMNYLIPAVIQDINTSQILMVGYMNQEALQQTLSTKKVTFFSRSKQRLWVKGETSGNFLELRNIASDCDNDSLLVTVKPAGPCCHLQTTSCFATEQSNYLHHLENIIEQRYRSSNSQSYTSKLFASGTKRIAQKVGEEGVEVALAAVCENKDKLISESADLLYHLLVLLKQCDSNLGEVVAELQRRAEQKKARN